MRTPLRYLILTYEASSEIFLCSHKKYLLTLFLSKKKRLVNIIFINKKKFVTKSEKESIGCGGRTIYFSRLSELSTFFTLLYFLYFRLSHKSILSQKCPLLQCLHHLFFNWTFTKCKYFHKSNIEHWSQRAFQQHI